MVQVGKAMVGTNLLYSRVWPNDCIPGGNKLAQLIMFFPAFPSPPAVFKIVNILYVP